MRLALYENASSSQSRINILSFKNMSHFPSIKSVLLKRLMHITQSDFPPWKKAVKINSNSFVLCFKT